MNTEDTKNKKQRTKAIELLQSIRILSANGFLSPDLKEALNIQLMAEYGQYLSPLR